MPYITGVFHLSAAVHIYAGDFETYSNYEEQVRGLGPLDHAVAVVDLARVHDYLGAFAKARQLPMLSHSAGMTQLLLFEEEN